MPANAARYPAQNSASLCVKRISPFCESAEKSKQERKQWRRRRRRYLTTKPGSSMALTAAFRKQSAFGVDDPRSSRDELFARYRRFREISKRHHHDILGCISSDALLNQARRLGLARGKTLMLEDMEEMNYVYDLAIHTASPQRSRAIDRFAGSARFAPGVRRGAGPGGDARGALLCSPDRTAPRNGRTCCHRPVSAHRGVAGRYRARKLPLSRR